jgi:hypothetical protein
MSAFKQAFDEWKNGSNHWSLEELKHQIEGRMDTDELLWVLIEIYAALLWPMNTQEKIYRCKARTLLRTLEERLALDKAPAGDAEIVRGQLSRKHDNAD